MLTISLRSHSAATSLRRVLKPEIESDVNFCSWQYSQRNRRAGKGDFSFPWCSSTSLHIPPARLDRNDDEFRSGWWKDRRERSELNANPFKLNLSRSYHTSPANERAVAIMLSLGAVSAASYGAAAAVKAYNEYKASLPDAQAPEEHQKESTDNGREESAGQREAKADDHKGQPPPRENIFVKWFNLETGYYEGGFEETMTKQEAALILGVRQSSSARRIKDAHRKLLILNHPDTGGSTYLAGKINEAKEIMLKGKRGEK
jgi:DnaJ homolog subfamily C member 19